MKGFNSIIECGFLTRDPELRYTPAGVPICTFGLAVNWVSSQETGRDAEVLFIDVVAWHKQAESCARFLKKGRQVLVAGRLALRRWADHNSAARFHYEIVAREVQFMDHPDGAPHGGGGEPLAVVTKESFNQDLT